MGSIKEFWHWAWDHSAWCPRTDCGDWPTWLINMHRWSDQAIWWAYVAISVVLGINLAVKRKKLRSFYLVIGTCFVAFIFSCGYGHHLESTMFLTPVYRAAGFVKLFTAIISWLTVAVLVYVTPKMLTLRTVNDCEQEIAKQMDRIRQDEQEMRLMIDSVKDFAIFSTDPQGHVKTWNYGAHRLFGWSEDEILGKHISILFTPEDQERRRCDQEMEEAMRVGHGDDERWHLRKDGSRFFARGLLTPIHDQAGGLLGFTKVCRDFTERISYENQLRDSQVRFQMMADNIQQLAWMARADGYIYWYNQRWYDYTGTTPQEMEGWGWQGVHDPEMLPLVLEKWKESLATGTLFDMTFPIRSASGEYRSFLARVMPVRDEQGHVVHWFGTNTDITDIRVIEQDLQKAKEAAETASIAKDQFLAVLSHEMRTPLTPCLLAASSMAIHPGTPEECKKAFANIQRNLELEARLIDDLLDVMLISKGKMSFHMTVIDAHHKIDLAVEICRPDLIDKQIHLDLHLDAEQHHITADAARFQQVMWNLIKNAVKFTPKGGTIAVSTRNTQEHIIIEVEDTGIGIKPEILETVFDAFEQGDRSRGRKYGGLGLGLSISRSIVEGHKGSLRAFSDGEGKGSCFVAEFQATYVPTLKKPVLEPEEKNGRAYRVFYVEDDTSTRNVMVMLMEASGYTVVACENLAAALQIDPGQWDILVSDIGLGDGTGLELMSRIRHDGGTIPGLALSGFGTEDDVKLSLAVGFLEHLTKPVPFPTLEAAIRRVAGHR